MTHWTPAADSLAERIILITGAGDGLGRALAIACAKQGATVILLDKTIAALESVYDEIEAAGGPQAAIYPMNLEGATPKDYTDLAATLENEFGRLDGLVHNAAELATLTPLAHLDAELWFRTLQVNLSAPFLLTQACLSLLMKSSDASVLFMSDKVAPRGKAYWGAYGVAKAGLENLMQMLADEMETNTSVRTNAFDPGPLRTRLRRLAYPGEDSELLPLPETAVPPCLYLLGAESQNISGQRFDPEHLPY